MKSYKSTGTKNLIVRNGWYHARVEVHGKAHWRSLHIEADPAGRNAPLAKDALRAFKARLAQDSFAILQLTRSRSEFSTFADLFTAYRAACAGRAISLASIERAIKDLRLIVRAVHGDTFAVDAARVSLCTPQLLIDFRAARIAALKAEAAAAQFDTETYQRRLHSTQVTIKSTIQHARSVFAQECLQEAAYRSLMLPDLRAFMAFRSGGSTTRAFEMPDLDTLAKLHEGAALFAGTRPDLWLALCLAANFGLRRGSCRVARWDWFQERSDGSALLRVRAAKGNHSTVGVAPSTWTALKVHQAAAAAAKREYVIPGADDTAREAVLEQVKDWLRGIGYDDARCPLHELRGLFVNTMAQEHSLDAAQGATGHSTQKVMMDSYVARGTDKWVTVV
jgi:integrase